jgi:ribosome-binding protein aMBF1 (putative translation factor)
MRPPRPVMKTVDVVLEELQWSLDDLSARCQLDVERVAAIVDGRWLPSPQERERIAKALGIPAAEISWGHTMSPRNVRYHRFGLKEDFNNP